MDHRINIYESAESASQYDDDCEFWESVLEANVFWDQYGNSRVEFLLGCGGPTVRVFVDQWDCVEYHHSWGKDNNGNDCEAIKLGESMAEYWRGKAEGAREFHPNPAK